MVLPDSSTPVGDPSDDLERIVGLDPWIAQLIRRSGIGRLSALAGLSAPALATILGERAAAALTPERIARDDWVGQARRLIGDAPDDDPVLEEAGGGQGYEPPVEEGCQQAGFSLFFDLVRDAQGRKIWHTRVYHEESGAEIVLPGIAPGAWSDWILAQALPVEDRPERQPAAPSPADPSAQYALHVRIVDSKVAGPGALNAGAQEFSAEVRVEVTGLAELERALGQATLCSVLGAR